MAQSLVFAPISRTSKPRDQQPLPREINYISSDCMATDSEKTLFTRISHGATYQSPTPSPCPSLSDGESNTVDTEEEEFSWSQPDYIESKAPRYGFLATSDPKLQTHASSETQHTKPQDAPNTESRKSLADPQIGTSSTKLTRKRKKRNAEDQDSSDGDGAHVKNGRLSQEIRDIRYACPFMKANPVHYRNQTSCFQTRLTTTPRVKEHLYRAHKVPIHCPRCGLTFKANSDRDQHLMQTTPCKVVYFTIEGMTDNQMTELRARRPRRGISEAERWYEMWDILFPGRERPASPYFEDINSAFAILQEFSNHTAALLPPMISEKLFHGAHSSQNNQFDIIKEAVSECLQLSLRQFTADPRFIVAPLNSNRAYPQITLSTSSSLPSDRIPGSNQGSLNIDDAQTSHTGHIQHQAGEQDVYNTPLRMTLHSEGGSTWVPPEVPSKPIPPALVESLDGEYQYSNAGTERGISTNDIWEEHKSSIQRLYIEENRPLNEVMAKMEDDYGFKASAKMYKTRFARWGFSKYMTSRSREPARSTTKSNVG